MPKPVVKQSIPFGDGFGSTATSKVTAAFDVAAGDVLLVLAGTADNLTTLTISNNGSATTWNTEKVTNTGSFCKAYGFTTTPGARTGMTVTLTRGGTSTNFIGGRLLVIGSTGGVGVSAMTNTNAGANQINVDLTGVSANSLLGWIALDWAALDGAARASRTNVPDAGKAVTGTASTDIFTCASHGYRAGDQVRFSSLTGGSGITAGTVYRVIAANLATNTFQVQTLAGVTLNFTTDLTVGTAERVYAEEVYFRDSSQWTVYCGYHEDAGSAATKNVGRTAPTGGTNVIVAVEIKGSSVVQVGRDLTIPWTIRAATGRDLQLPWTTRTAIGKDLTIRWTIRTATGRDLQLPWTVRTLSGRDLAIAWTIRTLAGRDMALDWLLRTLVGRDIALPWTIAAAIGRDLELLWDIEELGLVAVGRDLQIPWTIRVAAGRDLQLPWTLRTRSGRDLQFAWTLRALAGHDVGLAWLIRGLAGADLELAWRLREASGRDVDLAWLIRDRVGRDLQLAWRLGNPAGPSAPALVRLSDRRASDTRVELADAAAVHLALSDRALTQVELLEDQP